MIRHHPERFFPKHARVARTGIDRSPGDIEMPLPQQFGQPARASFPDVNIQSTAHQRRRGGADIPRRQRVHHPEAKPRFLFRDMIRLGVFAAAENLDGLMIKPRGSCGRRDPARPSRAFEQALSERLFEAPQSDRNRRLGDMQPIRRLADPAFFEDGDEDPKLLQFQVHAISPVSARIIDISYDSGKPDYIIFCGQPTYFRQATPTINRRHSRDSSRAP